MIIAVPSDRLRENVQRIKAHIQPGTIVLSATKGLELPTARRMSQVLEDELPAELHSGICVLSGPNLAKEIVDGKPASTVIAGRNPEAAQKAQNTLMSASFRVYTSADVLGVELAGRSRISWPLAPASVTAWTPERTPRRPSSPGVWPK